MAYITNADGSINYIFGQGNIERYSQERVTNISNIATNTRKMSNCVIVKGLDGLFGNIIKNL